MQSNHRTLSIAIRIVIILTAGILFAGCLDPLNPPEAPSANGKGKVLVSLSGETDETRTLLPQTQLTRYELTFTSDGKDPIVRTVTGTAEASVDLARGTWTITVKGFVTVNGADFEALKGTETLLVEAGNVYPF